jgi:hypothetical protein
MTKVSSIALSRTDFVVVPAGREVNGEESGVEGGLTNCTRIRNMMNCEILRWTQRPRRRSPRCGLNSKAMDTGFPVVRFAGGAQMRPATTHERSTEELELIERHLRRHARRRRREVGTL